MSQSRSDRVTIIGGGIIGIACAHYLQQDGYRVTVIDKGAVGAGCSLRNCGHILPSHVLPLNSFAALRQGMASMLNPRAPFKIKPTLSPRVLNWFWHFALSSRATSVQKSAAALQGLLDSSFDEFQTLSGEVMNGSDWRQNGLLYAFKNQRDLDQFAKTEDMVAERFGISADEKDQAALAAMDPSLAPDLAGGFLYTQDAQVLPEALMDNWVNYLKTQGVAFREQCSLVSIDQSESAISALQTTTGEIPTDHVVLAAGALSAELAKIFGKSLPVLPGKGYSVTLNNPAVQPLHSIVLPECHIAITPFENAMRIGSMMEFVGYDSQIPAFRLKQLTQNIAPYFSAPLAAEIVQPWFGWRPMTWDSLPIIGRLKPLKNVLVATGHNMIGLMAAPATGKLIAELLGERAPHLAAEAYSPNRFNA